MQPMTPLVEEQRPTTARKIAPGPRYRTPFGALAAFRRDPLKFEIDLAKFGGVIRTQMGPWFSHSVFHPAHVKYVLQDNNQNYGRSAFVKMLKSAVGDGLLTNEGESWLRQRRLAQPAFHRQRIAALVTLMTDSIDTMLERWRSVAENRQPVELLAEMSNLALDITGKALFGTALSSELNAFLDQQRLILAHFNYRFEHFLTLPENIPTPRNRRFHKAVQTMDAIAYKIIAERRQNGHDRGDLLSMLLMARDEETGEGMNDKQLRDEVTTFLGAGSETTAVLLAWAWTLLSLHPTVERKFRAELAEVLGGRTATIADLPNLKYTRMILDETLRLYPPAWAMSREVLSDDEIGGYHIPAKSQIFLVQYVTHRLPEFWENPEGFDPERFTPERSANRPRYAYFPFGGGPRLCIGNEFALMEAQLVLATVAQKYRLHVAPGHKIEPHPIFTLRPRYGAMVTLHQT